jgi:hypothetical protein
MITIINIIITIIIIINTITIIINYHHYHYYCCCCCCCCWKNKSHKFDLKDKIENHKNFDKRVKEKKPRNQKKDQIEFFFYYWKNKNIKLTWRIKLKA